VSQIDDLVTELCPDGVPYRPIGDFCVLVRGNGMPKSAFSDSGVGCIHYGQIYTWYSTWTTKTLSFISAEKAARLAKVDPGDLIVTNTSENLEDVCKAVAWLGDSQIVTGGHATVLKHSEDPKYLAYYFQTPRFFAEKKKLATGTKVIDVSAKSLAKIRVPLPPIEVQREVAKVLDRFADLEAKLETELEAELEARRQQYYHCRDQLFGVSAPTMQTSKWKALGEIAINLDSRRRPVTRGARTPGNIPYYGASGIVDYVSDYIFDGDYLLVSEDGANLLARSSPIAFSISGKSWVNNHAHVLAFESDVTRRFVELYLNSIDLSGYVSRAAQPKLNQANLNKIPIPVPAPEHQLGLVAVLSKFDALVNDVSIDLAAELRARREQYQYYRDRLFNFREAA
jgi:type I restriction enzyme S subunit